MIESTVAVQTFAIPGVDRAVPPSALVISLLALAVAAMGSVLWPNTFVLYSALPWLLSLVPPFLLAYHRGWRGAAVGLLFGMTFIVGIELIGQLGGREVDWRVPAMASLVLTAVSLGAGAVAERLMRDHEAALSLAYRDALTGLPNRRLLNFFLEKHFAAARRGDNLSVVLCDLDGFKAYNDQYGHRAGDEALRAMAGALERNSRGNDVSGRFGGDEFLCILPGQDLNGARAFAERMREAVELAMAPGAMTLSLGVAQYEPAIEEPGVLVERADRALYAAKSQGGNRVLLVDDPGEGAVTAAAVEDPAT
jgi:diguanylate cyclase (GGDEF)-like protein